MLNLDVPIHCFQIGSYNVNKLQWHKATAADIQKFRCSIKSKLMVINTPDVVYCTDFNCNNKFYKVQLTKSYNSILYTSGRNAGATVAEW